MKKTFNIFIAIAAVALLAACKKTPDYVATPYECVCGVFKWQNVDYQMLDANYILSDSTESESRRYYVTANVALEGEVGTHGLNAWIEIPDLDGGGQFKINQSTGVYEFSAWVDEFNVNDPFDSLRQYVPVEGIVKVTEAPITGGNETVEFLLTLNEVDGGVTIPGDVNCQGSFNVYINQ